MKAIGLLTSFWGLAVLSLLVFLWIMRYGSERLLEIRSMLIALIGGVAVSYGLILLFNHLILFSSLLSGHVRYQFPSRESLTAVVFYGYAAFMVMRHSERSMIRTAAGVAAFMICFFSGLSPVYLRIQYPSDVLAGFTFGGIWLSINIILLEVFRILPGIQPIRNKTDEP